MDQALKQTTLCQLKKKKKKTEQQFQWHILDWRHLTMCPSWNNSVSEKYLKQWQVTIQEESQRNNEVT